MRSIIILFLLASSPLFFGCSSSSSNSKSTLTDDMMNDSSLFMFEFKVLDMNTPSSLDSLKQAIDTISSIKGFAFSLPEKSCTFYSSEFKSHKSLISAIRNAGYTMDDVFDMKGPGLTCDIPAERASMLKPTEIEAIDRDLEKIKEAFNRNSNLVRVISLPNPSCLACVKGQSFINSIFSDSFPDESDLFGITVWLSINGWGTLDDANRLAPEISDDRMIHFWDERAMYGKALKKTLGIKPEYQTAWDVYLIYDKGIEWHDDPPKPSFWMHQLTEENSGVSPTNALDHMVFAKNLQDFLQIDDLKDTGKLYWKFE